VAAKSIFDVEVDDAKFKAFAALFQKYQQGVQQLPGQWAKVNASLTPVLLAIEGQTQALVKVLQAERQVASQAGVVERSWRGISSHVREAERRLLSITGTLLKWTGIGGLLSTVLGAVSVDRLADSVSATRRSAAGLGIGYGQQQAFGLDLGRFVDPGTVLGAARNALFDVTNPAYIALRAAGIAPGGNAADVSAKLLERLPAIFQGTPQGLIGPRARALGLDQFFGLDDIVRFLGASPGERQKQLGAFKQDSRDLELQRQVTRQWQDFSTALGRAGYGIEKTFVEGLTPLTPSLEKLAGSVNRAVSTFLAGADKWIKPFGDGIERFAKYLVSDDFAGDVKTFKDSVGEVASALSWLASWIKAVTPGGGDGSIGSAALSGAGKGAAIGAGIGLFSPIPGGTLVGAGIGAAVGGIYGAATFSQAEGNLLKLVGDLENAKRDPNAVSRTGARGLYQIQPSTAQQYNRDPSRLFDPSYNAEVAQVILRDLVRRYHGDLDKVLVAYHSGPGAVDNPSKFPLGPEGRAYIQRAHANQGYQKVIIEIHDQTGASAVTAGSQIGQGGVQ
jgi:hypothetical protein